MNSLLHITHAKPSTSSAWPSRRPRRRQLETSSPADPRRALPSSSGRAGGQHSSLARDPLV